ncbi:MsnO8 family LLM class oxidoreductase [Conexibacter sp. W3-3-2]|uniref:LLM class flavin-dependent oxidoreductase n=1 Tax=Conexibacter sp. W3-3-2 TaxID=2675227 RepID=UPI0012B80F60|nr:LLM class flavin-dependent oxidoreductase [Conexibacter sp. W3-3-2]MTD44415.1 MsnO8 family LLM class oxidoreductase [Conexibacter sp. W3-3-2]
MALRLSILDLATSSEAVPPGAAMAASVELARAAERLGYTRYWFSEHHNMPTIVSSAPAVLAAHVLAHTDRIRVGAGGVMLPNHSPLVVAEQFGTLESLHPGRVDLGLGRAPGGDQHTFAALRRDPAASSVFPQDVLELQALLGDPQPGQRVHAVPGEGTHVPLYILGSSQFGAQLAAHLGLPYAFASHFAPAELVPAVARYRAEFRPSEQLEEPYVIAGLNVFAADDDRTARELFEASLATMARGLAKLAGRPAGATDAELLASPIGRQARMMLHHSAVGAPATVRAEVLAFAAHADADEVIVAMNTARPEVRLRSYELLAEAFADELAAACAA